MDGFACNFVLVPYSFPSDFILIIWGFKKVVQIKQVLEVVIIIGEICISVNTYFYSIAVIFSMVVACVWNTYNVSPRTQIRIKFGVWCVFKKIGWGDTEKLIIKISSNDMSMKSSFWGGSSSRGLKLLFFGNVPVDGQHQV